MRKLIMCLLAFPYVACAATWRGDTGNFIFTADSINLNVSESATSVLYRESDTALDFEMSFGVNMSYAPSSSNCIMFYMMSSDSVLQNASSAYYLLVGGTRKTFVLFRQDGKNSKDTVACAQSGLLQENYAEIYLQINRDDNVWKLQYKFDKGDDYAEAFIAEDDKIQASSYCGFVVKNTVTRGRGFKIFDLQMSGRAGERVERASFGDIVINELLFNPADGGSDYLELYNLSDKNLSLEGCRVSNGKTDETLGLFEIKGRSYLVLTEDKTFVCDNYDCADSLVVEMDLPSFSDESGRVEFYAADGQLADSLTYSEEMHSAFVSNPEGVALERINPLMDSWQSASFFENYGTPGRQNSQYTDVSPIDATAEVWVSPEAFSPDGDGFADIVQICHKSVGAYPASLYIYHADGYMVKQLFFNKLVQTTDCYVWDGADDKGRICAPGFYVAVFEAYRENADAFKAKIPFVLTVKR